MRLIVGLGNPGRTYAHTRHNVGFDVIDAFARKHRVRVLGRQCTALVGSFDFLGEPIMLAKPQTFMNDSGSAVAGLVRKHHVEPGDLVVVYDDMDLPLGRIRIRMKGSSGGHKGMNSIIHHLGSADFPRIRIGIGHQGEAINHVLSRFNRKDRQVIDGAVQDAADALEMILNEGIEAAMNVYNRTEDGK